MGKRSDFERNKRDFYPTPKKGVIPLLPHLPSGATYAEPCCGSFDLINHLGDEGLTCNWASDIQDPVTDGKFLVQDHLDALELSEKHLTRYFGERGCDYIITNPPWNRKILHPMIHHFRKLRPTWLLLDADWAFTKQSSEYMKYCEKFVAVGRLKWIPDSKHTGKDNCAWYLFRDHGVSTTFIGR